MDTTLPLSDIPILDLSDLLSSSPAVLRPALEAIRVGYSQFGLLFIKNHGVDLNKVQSLYSEYNDFCALPTEKKQALSRADVWYQRGWTPPNTEQAIVAGGQPDFKECYFVSPLPLSDRCLSDFPEIYAENIWPDGRPVFRDSYQKTGESLHSVGEKILSGCAMAFGLPPDTFSELIEGAAHVTRVLRYLSLSSNQINTDILWGEEHTDFNLLTLLPGGQFYDPEGKRCERPDSNAGLYLRTHPTKDFPNGRMLRGTAPEGCIVTQVGQQLEILTGGEFKATPHIVRPPQKTGFTRCSVAHFVHVEAHQTLSPLAPLKTKRAASHYRPPVLAGNYAMKTIVDIGLAPASTLNRLGFRSYDRLASMRSSDLPLQH